MHVGNASTLIYIHRAVPNQLIHTISTGVCRVSSDVMNIK